MDHMALIESVAETLWQQQSRRRFGREPKRAWNDLALVEKQIFRKAAKVSCSTILGMALSQIFQQVKTGLIPGRNYAASSAKTLNGEPLSFANWFLRIMCATSMPAMVAAAE